MTERDEQDQAAYATAGDVGPNDYDSASSLADAAPYADGDASPTGYELAEAPADMTGQAANDPSPAEIDSTGSPSTDGEVALVVDPYGLGLADPAATGDVAAAAPDPDASNDILNAIGQDNNATQQSQSPTPVSEQLADAQVNQAKSGQISEKELFDDAQNALSTDHDSTNALLNNLTDD